MGFVEVKAPKQIKFQQPGEWIEGVLVGMDNHTVKGKQTVQYMVEQSNGERVTFLATWDLAQKLTRKALGFPVHVEFDKLHDSIERNGNKAKIFKVMVDWTEKQQPVASLEITDDDIPF